MKLYDLERSGNCYKIRLLLSCLGLAYERVAVNIDKGEHKTDAFLRLNPRAQVPVLEDEGRVIWDSTAILVYLARRFGGETWLPTEPFAMAQVMQWLVVEQNEGRYGTSRARARLLKMQSEFARSGEWSEIARLTRAALQTLEGQLRHNDWLAADHVTIADVACYPYTALLDQDTAALPDGFSVADYPAIRAWFRRMEGLPGHVPLPRQAASV
ncbi:MAG: glutathione S-transferase family protein [Gammaproteobacteria bacterium]|nr:glutathione S-transferase family protein [Gammaproteobacteria bacterium]